MQEGRVTCNCDRGESAKEWGGPPEGPGGPESQVKADASIQQLEWKQGGASQRPGPWKNWEPAKQARFRAQKQPRVPNIYIVWNVASKLVWKFKQFSKSQEESRKRKGSEEEWQQKKDLDHTAASTCPGQRVCGILPKTKANLSWAHNWMCLRQILPCPRNILIMNRFPQGRSKHTPACVKSTRHGPIIFKVAEQEHWITFYLDKFSLFYTLLKYLLIGK